MYEFKKIFKRNHRIVCLLLSCFLSFGTVTTEYLEVQAFEWIAPAIGIEEAIKYLLMILGVSIGAKTVGDNVDWDSLKQDCITFQENQGNSEVAVSQWWADVLSGKLDQASNCWISFKEWVHSIISGFSGDYTVSGMVSSVLPSNLTDLSSYNFSVGYAVYFKHDGQPYSFLFVEEGAHLDNLTVNGCSFSSPDGKRYRYLKLSVDSGQVSVSAYSDFLSSGFNFSRGSVSDFGFFYGFGDLLDLTSVSQNFYLWSFESSDSPYNVVVLDSSSINDLQLAISSAISDAIPDVIPLPWEQVAETSDAIQDLIDRLIEQVNEGVLSISDAMVRVQELLGLLVVDSALDGVLVPERPNPDTGEPEKLEDKAKENQDNQGFTLFGLEKVFPFCIPFDIYAFMTLLVSEPVAPVINWPVYNPITQQNEVITIDFSTWESVVVLFRYIFDFLFIIGMLLMARALIGGGDSA